MSKNIEQDIEIEDEGEYEEEEEDETINNSDVVVKYKKAAQWTNEVLQEMINAVKPGAKVLDLCQLGDRLITEKVATMFRGVEKGASFPPSVSLNNCVCHNSPVPGEGKEEIIAVNDVVHIELGIHVDGYVAVVAHTVVASPDNLLPDNKIGNVINAAYTAMNTAVRKMRPGTKGAEVTDVLDKVAHHFDVNPIEGCLSHMMKRYIVDSVKSISLKKHSDHMPHPCTIDAGQVWTLDVCFTTGKGKLREDGEYKCSVYKATPESEEYTPIKDSAKELFNAFKGNYFPFSIRSLHSKTVRLGLTELLKNKVVDPFPVLCEREGEAVGHFKMTLLVTNKKIERITGLPAQKVTKEAEPFKDELLLTTMKLPFSLKEKKEKS
eukprot:Tbor_TRINITY_DN4466_c0_g3::TRINITY_DN4466_c0_g3_i1::g.7990::m.7990